MNNRIIQPEDPRPRRQKPSGDGGETAPAAGKSPSSRSSSSSQSSAGSRVTGKQDAELDITPIFRRIFDRLSRLPFKWWVILVILIAITSGYFFGMRLRIPTIEYTSADETMTATFREKPVESYMPFLEDYAASPMLSLSSRHSLGLDEINRLRGVKSPDAARLLFSSMVIKTGGQIVRDDPEDFLLFLPEQNSYVRGRVFFARGGGTIYRVWSLRETQADLEDATTVKFLFGVKINDKTDQ